MLFGNAGLWMCGTAASASEAAMPAFTVVGIMRVLNGGDVNNHAVARTSARTNAVIAIGSIGTVIGNQSVTRATRQLGRSVSPQQRR